MIQVVRMGNETAAHIALLAPVPLVHLESALQTDTPDGQVAFGTRAWELFNEIDRRRAGLPVDVYIYESHPKGSFEGKVTWHAEYIRVQPDREKAKPYRPKSTKTDSFDGEVYWIVERLRRMQPNEHISVADFVGYGQRKPYGKTFPPHRPLLVERPL